MAIRSLLDLERLGYRFGDPSLDSFAGGDAGSLQNADPTQFRPTGAFERAIPGVLSAIGEYGSAPAKAYVKMVDEAATPLANFIDDPNYVDLAEGAIRTAMVGGSPAAVAGTTIAGYGIPLLGHYADKMFSAPAKAEGMSLEEAANVFKGKSPAEIKAIQRMIGVADDGKVGPNTAASYKLHMDQKARESAAAATAAAQAAAAAEAEKQKGETAKLAVEKEAEQKARDALALRIDNAKKERDARLAILRDPEAQQAAKPYASQLYDRLGILAPLAGGVTGGFITGKAVQRGAGFGNKIIDKWVLPALGGAELGSVMGRLGLAEKANNPGNPQYPVWQDYLSALPAEATEEQERALSHIREFVPKLDPAAEKAGEMLKDPVKLGFDLLGGALSGMTGGGLSVATKGGARRAGRIPGEFYQGLKEGFSGTAKRGSRTKSPLGDAADAVEKFADYPAMAAKRPDVADRLFSRVVVDAMEGKNTTPKDLHAIMREAGVSAPVTSSRLGKTRNMARSAAAGNGKLRRTPGMLALPAATMSALAAAGALRRDEDEEQF